jgi:predicted membrane GTPase involved in stress response
MRKRIIPPIIFRGSIRVHSKDEYVEVTPSIRLRKSI